MKIVELMEYIISIPKSFYVSYRLCPFTHAWKMPLMVRYNCILRNLKGRVIFPVETVTLGMIKIGFGHVGSFDKKYERSILEIAGDIMVYGNLFLGHGSRVCVGENGKLVFGNGFVNTAQMTVVCSKKITFGNNVLTSWDTLVMDTDFHETINTENNVLNPIQKAIVIGDNVWLGARSVVLKGSVIPNGCIIGALSLVNRKFEETNCLIAGNPSEIKKRGITRKLI